MNIEPGPTRRHCESGIRRFRFLTPRPSSTTGNFVVAAFSLMAICFSACDKNQLAPFDSTNTAPLVSQLTFSPDSVYLDSLIPSGGEYMVSTTIHIRASDGNGAGDIQAVQADVLMQDGSLVVRGAALHDDGTSPDSAGGDGIYSGSVQFQLTRAQAGRWQVRVAAVDQKGAFSNSLSGLLKLARRNSLPQLANLVAPDTLTIAPGDSSLLVMTIAASDSDGLADITEVYWLSPDGQNPNFHFPMKDDGGLSQGPPSGDLVAGDGIFSYRQWIRDSPSIRGTYRLVFKAQDSVGDTSSSLLHNLIIR